MGFSLPSPPLSEGSGLAELQEWLTDTERPDLVADLDTHNALPAPAETLPQRRPNDRSTSRVVHDGSSTIITPGNADDRANNYNINDSPEAMTAPLEPEFQSILTLRSLGYTYLRIVTVRGVQYTCEQRSASPKRRPGRSRLLSESKLQEIEAFVTASVENRRLSDAQLIEKMALAVKEDTLVAALRRRGYTRQMAFLRSPLAPRGGNRTAKPIRTFLTCRRDEEIDCPSVLEIVRT